MNPVLSASVLCSALFLAGCSAPPYAAQAIENDAELTSNVVVADDELYDVVRVGRAGVERVPGTNQLKISVPVRNIDDEQIQVLLQVSFLNSQKMPIGDDTNQQVKLIGPGSTYTHVVFSKQPEAQDWTLRISWNK
jgi:PBP1b-binding outer membrane lipoprotein LpoB